MSVILTDKPAGITSRKWDDKVARTLGLKKTGHVGTLDPMATGLQIVLSGRTTRLLQFFLDGKKTYKAQVTFGFSTDTWDREGEILERCQSYPELTDVLETLKSFDGVLIQTPPPYSAVKVEGKPLYYWTRKGIAKEAPPREVFVESITEISYSPPDLEFSISCSKGTYIRSIADQLGKKLGCPSHLSALRRTAIHPFELKELDTENEIHHKILSPFEALSLIYPTVECEEQDVAKIRNGIRPYLGQISAKGIFLICYESILIAVAETTTADEYRLRTVYTR